MSASYGYRTGDRREVIVHVVGPDGWQDGGAVAMCGAGLNREAPWPVEPQKWCRSCTDARHRRIRQTVALSAGSFFWR